MNIDDPFWDTFELLPLTAEAQADADHFNCCGADAFEAAWERSSEGRAMTITDEQGEYLAAWVKAHPVTLADWEKRIHDLSAEHEAAELDEDTQRGDMANWESARVYGGRDVD